MGGLGTGEELSKGGKSGKKEFGIHPTISSRTYLYSAGDLYTWFLSFYCESSPSTKNLWLKKSVLHITFCLSKENLRKSFNFFPSLFTYGRRPTGHGLIVVVVVVVETSLNENEV